MIFVLNDRISDANFRVLIILAKPWIDFCQNDSISECKHKSYMADLLDFWLSPKMHIKIKVMMGFLLNYKGMCRTIA